MRGCHGTARAGGCAIEARWVLRGGLAGCIALSMAALLDPAAGQVASPEVREAPVRYDADLLPPAFHGSRRDLVSEALPADGVALFFSAPVRVRQNDVNFEYRQDSDLLYLTGSHEPGSALLLAPGGVDVGGRTVREILFVPPRDPVQEVWTGRRFGADRAEEELGVEAALAYDRFDDVVRPLLQADRPVFRLPPPGGVPEGSPLDEQLSAVASHPPERRLRALLDSLRMVKTDEEVELLQRAVDITGEALREAMAAIEPGVHEYEVEALIQYAFHARGAEHPGFPSIIASGENAVILHYETNRRRMEADDLVVMDVGAELHGYTADVTRTVPVDGTFSEEQRAIYALVLEAQEAGIEAVRAGAPFQAPGMAAARVLAGGLAELGLIESPTDVQGLRRFFMHGTSHYLGLDVHDVGTGGPLVPGTVLTVEPGLYVAPAEDVDPRWWNIGVRIEDDVLVTEDGPVVLSADVPRTVAEVEEAMRRQPGLVAPDGGR